MRRARLAALAALACAASACILLPPKRDWQSELAGDVPIEVHNQTTFPFEVYIYPYHDHAGDIGQPWGGGPIAPEEKRDFRIKPGTYTVLMKGEKPGRGLFNNRWTLFPDDGATVFWVTEYDLDAPVPSPGEPPPPGTALSRPAPPGTLEFTLFPEGTWARAHRSSSSPAMSAPGPAAGGPAAEPAPQPEPAPAAAACKPDGAEAGHYSECCSQEAYTEEIQDPVSGAWRNGRHLCGRKP